MQHIRGTHNQCDVYIAVDWSAKNTPSPPKPSVDAIWVGIRDTLSQTQSEQYFRTRWACHEFLQDYLINAVKSGKKVLIGYDFDLGFPAGLAKAMGYHGPTPWSYMAEFLKGAITDTVKNTNNRFEVAALINRMTQSASQSGPFWGCPVKTELEGLKPTSPQYPFVTGSGTVLRNKRWCEHRESKAQPVWKLLGTASVGGQSLMGIPMVQKLREHPQLQSCSRVWPFETGFHANVLAQEDIRVIHVEIWPGLLTGYYDTSLPVRDQAQVRATVDWFHKLDAKGHLTWLMTPPEWLTPEMIEDAKREEGWVIGSGLSGKLYPDSEEATVLRQANLFE